MADLTDFKGACLCGAVVVAAQVAKLEVDACHCSMCRKWAGAPLLAMNCEASVAFTGEDNITVYASSDWAERAFCKVCGTHLFYRMKDHSMYSLPAGLLDDTDEVPFHLEIFIDEKPANYAFAGERKRMTGAQVFEMFGAAQS